MLELGADAADEIIAKRRETTQQDDRAIFELAVGLWNRREGDVTFVHGRRSAEVYSGSFGP